MEHVVAAGRSHSAVDGVVLRQALHLLLWGGNTHRSGKFKTQLNQNIANIRYCCSIRGSFHMKRFPFHNFRLLWPNFSKFWHIIPLLVGIKDTIKDKSDLNPLTQMEGHKVHVVCESAEAMRTEFLASFTVCFLLFFCSFWFLVLMEGRVDQRAVLKFLAKSGETPINCWRKLKDAFGDRTMSKS